MGAKYSLEGLACEYGIDIGALFELARSLDIDVTHAYDRLEFDELLSIRSAILDMLKDRYVSGSVHDVRDDRIRQLSICRDAWKAEAVGGEAKRRALESELSSLRGLPDTLRKKDAALRSMSLEVERRKQEVVNLRSAVAERDSRIDLLREEVSRRDEMIESLKVEIDLCRSGRMGEQESWSWRDSPAKLKELARERLHGRFEHAAARLLGSWSNPDVGRIDSARVDRIRALSFGDDHHPDCYGDEDAIAYYTLRFEMGYAFEYYHMYRDLLSQWVRHTNKYGFSCDSPFEVVSVGAGQGLDLWGLLYAFARNKEEGWGVPRVSWVGVDMEDWPNRIVGASTGNGITYVNARIEDYLPTLKSMPTALVFPKSLCELPDSVISRIVDWIRGVEFAGPLHYICIAHTDRESLERFGRPDTRQYDRAERQDASKAARLLEAFEKRADCRTRLMFESCNGIREQCGQFVVDGRYFPFSCFDRDCWFGDYDKTADAFVPFGRGGKYSQVFGKVGRLFMRCSHWKGDPRYVPDYGSPNCTYSTCDERVRKQCRLDRYPRVKVRNMAFQIFAVGDFIPF